MFTHKDIEHRTVFVLNCIEHRTLKVQTGELVMKDTKTETTLTKLPLQKMLALFVIGHVSITTPLIEKCNHYGVPIVVMKPNLRPVFFFSTTAEANFLLRKRQYEYLKDNLTIPRVIVTNKIKNQITLLQKTRIKQQYMQEAVAVCSNLLKQVATTDEYEVLMGIEGRAAKCFFNAFYMPFQWRGRSPRTKIDPINATLDIGYTILFNYVECFVRLFGFDPYKGVFHQQWFKRKSLICDLMEPFRCLIDSRTRNSFQYGTFKAEHFQLYKNEHHLKREHSAAYTRVFYELLVEHKGDLFRYIQTYYRAFMRDKAATDYPQFLI